MPRGLGTSSQRTAPALALTLALFVAAADAPAASGNAPRPASPRGGEARNSGTPQRTDRPAGPTNRPAGSVRPQADRPGAPDGPAGKRGGWVLTFSDDFDGRALDKTKWANGFGWGQATNSDFGWCDPRNNVVSGGILTQRIERRPGGGQPFRVGCIHSKDKFAQRYGYWEARIRAAGCFGSRTAFWGKPNDESWPPEIDVVEVNGEGPRTDTAKFTVHWRRGGRHLQQGDVYTGPNFSEDYHVFGAEWSPDGVVFYVDGVERWRTPAGSRFLDKAGPFYTIVNSQVIERDSTCGDIPSRAASYVDYVRVWSPEPGARPPTGKGPGRPADRDGDCGLPVHVESRSPLPPGNGEASGAVASKRFPGVGWFIRDSGNPASLYAFRVDGSGSRRVREVTVTGAANRDWEDLTYYVGADGRGRLLIIESGQSGGDRFIYEVVEPDPDDERTAPAQRYQYAYGDLDARQANTESAFMIGDRLALVTKTNPGRIYRFDDLSDSRVNRPKFMGPLVDADRVSVVRLSPDRRTLVAASHTRAMVYEGLPPATPIRGVVGRKPSRITGVDRGANIEAGDWFPHDSCRLLLLAENRSTYELRLSSPGSTTAYGETRAGDRPRADRPKRWDHRERRPRRGPARASL
jgi:beta-glucanase (GH16 family)